MRKRGITGLKLNTGKGWKGNEVGFLESLDFLERLSITNLCLDDVSAIHGLTRLSYLEISAYHKTKINFGCFPALENCVLECRPGGESLWGCTTLKTLYLNCFKGKDSAVFKPLVNLRWLRIGNGPLPDVAGLSDLANLEYLALHNLRNLTSLAGIETLRNLSTLEVIGCRQIHSIDQVSRLKNLAVFDLSTNSRIDSLRPLEAHPSLRDFYFVETTNIVDGDLTPLQTIPKLGRLFFQNRRHYTHRREQFWQFTRGLPCIPPPMWEM